MENVGKKEKMLVICSRRFWLTKTKKKEEVKVSYNRIGARLDKRRKKEKEEEKGWLEVKLNVKRGQNCPL